MTIQISEHFNYKKLIRFVLPSIFMMILSSIYGVIDGFFVSNFVGKTPFAAINLVMPFVMILGGMGFMLGTGGTALKLFVGYDEELFALTVYAFRIFSFSFVFSGINIYASGFFTALNNGLVSAILSSLRSLVFQTAFVFLLPLLLGIDGIWWAMFATETCAFLVSDIFFLTMRKRYGYA